MGQWGTKCGRRRFAVRNVVCAAQPPKPNVLFNLSAEAGLPEAEPLEGSNHNLYGTTCTGGQ